MRLALIIPVLLLSLFIPALHAQDDSFVEKEYEKNSYDIEMRDGVKLHTIVYTPKDKTKEYPFLIWRTPYSIRPYGNRMRSRLSSNKWIEEDGYIFVFQDVRGKYMSEGTFSDMRPVLGRYPSEQDVDETTDTWDTVDWLIKNIRNNNGKAGMYGVSYPGFYSVMGSINAHPGMKAISPQAPISDWFMWDDMHHNGAFTLPLTFNFFQSFGQPRPEPTMVRDPGLQYVSADMYHFFLDLGPVKHINEKYLKGEVEFWNHIMEHPNYDDFWKSRSTLPHLDEIGPAMLTVGGWYDGEDLSGALHTYKTIEKNDPGAENYLVMGPYTHGGWHYPQYDEPSLIPFRQDDPDFFLREVEAPFFRYYLKGEGVHNIAEARMFETGGDQWRTYDAWPPGNVKPEVFYLQEELKLGDALPVATGESYQEFVSDPDKPVPYTSVFHSARAYYNRQYLAEDQRFAATRQDVLVFEGETLQQDVTYSGPVHVDLFVSTTGTDADWVVKLIDVYPDTAANLGLDPRDVEIGGYQMLVRGDIFRGKYRNSFEHPEPFVPGEVAHISFDLPDINHRFRKGHHIMVQVQSSWFPLFDMNPQTFTNIYTCDEDAFRKAVHRVYHTPGYPSGITMYRNE